MDDFSQEQHNSNKKRLNVSSYDDLIGEKVYYVRPSYGMHTVKAFTDGEFLLEINGQKFYSNPFRLIRI